MAAEPLARDLGTTKGSFYWHFKDVPAFQDALLATWRRTALDALAARAGAARDPDHDLRQFGRDVLGDTHEVALRVWATSEPRVATMLKDVDLARHEYLMALLGHFGLGNPAFARALQAALIGLPQLPAKSLKARSAPFETLIDTVLALAEA